MCANRRNSWKSCDVQVKIMRPHDPTGKIGPKKPLPDVVVIHEPKEEEAPADKGLMKGEEDTY